MCVEDPETRVTKWVNKTVAECQLLVGGGGMYRLFMLYLTILNIIYYTSESCVSAPLNLKILNPVKKKYLT